MTTTFSCDRRTTVRLGYSLLILFLASAAAGCKRAEPVKVEQADEEGPRMASTVHTGDPKSESQLVNGFYGIEQNSWRWTGQRFSVVLRPPAGAAQRGASLVVNLSVPDPVIAKLKTISLSGGIGGTSLAPETYTQPGPYVYKRDIAPAALNSETVRVDFQLDKVMQPSGGDLRELGIVVTSVGLEPR